VAGMPYPFGTAFSSAPGLERFLIVTLFLFGELSSTKGV